MAFLYDFAIEVLLFVLLHLLDDLVLGVGVEVDQFLQKDLDPFLQVCAHAQLLDVLGEALYLFGDNLLHIFVELVEDGVGLVCVGGGGCGVVLVGLHFVPVLADGLQLVLEVVQLLRGLAAVCS